MAGGFADGRRTAEIGGEGIVSARVRIIGAGLAGSEAAWQCAQRGVDVELFEMRPVRSTPAHQTADFAELVCSNSLKSDSENTAPWLLKEEMRRAESLLLQIARECAVPAGHALAVDRVGFAAKVTEAISREPRITVRREEVTSIEEAGQHITIIATGPLTSEALAGEIARLSAGIEESKPEPAGVPAPHNRAAHNPHLYFYDSISPIVEADSIDMSRVYMAARYDKGSADYINCPMTREDYDRFYDALLAAQSVEERDWEKLNYFESCLPIEEIARRGRDTLRFGPMKPVGLKDPRTGRMPYAVVQLRQENLRADSYNLVGFQNHLKFGEQARVLRLIPGLENARFLRYGQIHRNTYINAPALLQETLADEGASANFVCRTDLRCGRLCRVDCNRIDGGTACSGVGGRRSDSRAATGFRVWIVDPLHNSRGCEKLSAGQHHFRSLAGSREKDSRPERAAPVAVRAGVGAI